MVPVQRARVFALTLLMFVSLADVIYVAAQTTNGAISGTVTDPSGAVIPGVAIQVKNVLTGIARSMVHE